MTPTARTIYIGANAQNLAPMTAQGAYVPLLGELFYKIENYDALPPFFMSIVSGSDHWLFISSAGGLSAGRGSADHALFPYYTDDKIADHSEDTGSKSLFLITRAGRTSLWEPFSNRQRGIYAVERNLYKNIPGTALVFEEINRDLGLTFRCAWRTGERFGFVKTCWLLNTAGPCRVEVLDGLQNLLPAHATTQTQNTFSNLLDAYKRSELEPETGLAVFGLNSQMTDLAEPAESLLYTSAAQVGLADARYLLSSAQLDRFRAGEEILSEREVRGKRGAYFVQSVLELPAVGERSWHLLADVDQDAAALAEKLRWLRLDLTEKLRQVESDLQANRDSLWQIVASADGVQASGDLLVSAHHFANVMFNVMRGGVFADQYWVRAADFADYISARRPGLLREQAAFFAALPEKVHLSELLARARASGSGDLLRLASAYLPLTFSRRHGDPSRPWNRFAINIKKPDGSLKLHYEGNWRDIFQNWQALAVSYPEFTESMISTFLDATTADGYNPYRITLQGLDWELPEPGNPWANIGYWSDHQIIYLLVLMEFSQQAHPGRLQEWLGQPLFSYAQVPYRIKSYAELLADPYNTIQFDWELEKTIEARSRQEGGDGKLLHTPTGSVLQVNLTEKLLTLLLAKLSNLVPEGGIWMNTQRPEWNDANNALVGKGLSVVTLCYLRRYIAFCRQLFAASSAVSVPLSAEVDGFYRRVAEGLRRFHPVLRGSFSDAQRRQLMDELGQAGSDYRQAVYQAGLSGESRPASLSELVGFLELAQQFVEHSLRANRREDALYHAYNVLHLSEGRALVDHLYEMLEGQTAILASGMLSGEETLALLDSLRRSRLYRADQHSYILYPDRELPDFLHKNRLSAEQVNGLGLVAALVQAGDRTLITRDVDGFYHFGGNLRNAKDLSRALDALRQQPRYAALVEADAEHILALFEQTFRHIEFTGRSGTFFAYEGLGSIYWHMISKLLLAVQESAQRLRGQPQAGALVERYADIRRGLGFNKPPQVYGAFPTDPYSHTPKGQGAKQPGMTGMVKEEILTRLAEVGLTLRDGRIVFDPQFVDRRELLAEPGRFEYLDVNGRRQTLELPAGSLGCTLCQTPIVLQTGASAGITVHFSDSGQQFIPGGELDVETSRHIFQRDGVVRRLEVMLRL